MFEWYCHRISQLPIFYCITYFFFIMLLTANLLIKTILFCKMFPVFQKKSVYLHIVLK